MLFEVIIIPDLINFFLNTIGRDERGAFLSILIQIRQFLFFEVLNDNAEQNE